MTERILPDGTHAWVTIEKPDGKRLITVNAVIESHSYGRGGLLRYRIRDHETGGVYIVWSTQVQPMS